MRAEEDRLTVAIHDRQDWSQWINIDKWEEYNVFHSVWDDCGQFSLTPTPTDDLLKTFRYPGQGIEIWCNERPQMTGIVEQVSPGATASGATTLQLSGRDNAGLLVDSSAPRMGIVGLTFRQLIEKLLQPWYPKRIAGITTNNAVNFYRMVGKKVKVYEQMPVRPYENWIPRKVAYVTNAKQITASAKALGYQDVGPRIEWRDMTKWKVKGGVNSPQFAGTDEPHFKRIRGGEKVMDIIKDVCQSVACFATLSPELWFTVAKPRYSEQPYEKLVFKSKGNVGHVQSVERSSSISNRFSVYMAYGKGKKTRTSKGRDNRHSYGAYDPSPAFWKYDKNGQIQEALYKPCIVEARRGSKNSQMLRRLVRTKMEENACRALDYTWTVTGHRDPGSGIQYAPDACIEVQDEKFGVKGLHYIVSVRQLRGLRGTTSELRLIPANIWLYDTQDLSDEKYAEWMSGIIGW